MIHRLLAWTAVLLALSGPALAESDFEQEIRLFQEGLDIGPGAVVADIGAGDGTFAVALAGVVGPTGRVIATEIEAGKRDTIRAAGEAAGVALDVREARIEGTGLEPACCDAIYLRDVYHHLTSPKTFTKSLFDSIRPGGRLMIVDFPPAWLLSFWTPKGVPEDRGGHGIRPPVLIGELEAAGFRAIRTIDPWPSANFVTHTYGVVFERP